MAAAGRLGLNAALTLRALRAARRRCAFANGTCVLARVDAPTLARAILCADSPYLAASFWFGCSGHGEPPVRQRHLTRDVPAPRARSRDPAPGLPSRARG